MAVLIPGCPPDTCTQGDNMTDPRLVNDLEPANGASQVRITWDPGTGVGADLPDAYFSAVNLGESAGTPITQSDLIRSVQLTASRELTVTFQDTFVPATVGMANFRLFFPDRRDFITCSHPGDTDRYFLDVTLELTPEGTVRNAALEQGKQLGEI